jgi:transposase-like protein
MARKTNHKKSTRQSKKANIALQAINRHDTISRIAENNNCSRTTVYKHRDIAVNAIHDAFDNSDDRDVIFYLPVTKQLIRRVVVALFTICKSSYRDIIFFWK